MTDNVTVRITTPATDNYPSVRFDFEWHPPSGWDEDRRREALDQLAAFLDDDATMEALQLRRVWPPEECEESFGGGE